MGIGMAALMLAGCVMGGTVESFAPAATPAGLDVTLRLGGRSVAGELLAVEDSSLLLVVRFPNPDSSSMPRLARVQTRRIRSIEGSVALRGGWVPSDSAKYRRMARYPQGVNRDLEARLVAAYQVLAVGWVPE
jgi:hypothetical protein